MFKCGYFYVIYCINFHHTANCTCDVNTDANKVLRTVCTGPSTAPCVCNDTVCKVHMYTNDFVFSYKLCSNEQNINSYCSVRHFNITCLDCLF